MPRKPQPELDGVVPAAPGFESYLGNPDFVLSFARGLRVIECFDGNPEGRSVGEIARGAGLTRTAVGRLRSRWRCWDTPKSGRAYRLKTRVPGSLLSLVYVCHRQLNLCSNKSRLRFENRHDEGLDGDQMSTWRGLQPRAVRGLWWVAPSCVHTSMGRVLLSGYRCGLDAYLARSSQGLHCQTITDCEAPRAILKVRTILMLLQRRVGRSCRSRRTVTTKVVAAINVGAHAPADQAMLGFSSSVAEMRPQFRDPFVMGFLPAVVVADLAVSRCQVICIPVSLIQPSQGEPHHV
jgi:hypothetical protein